MIPENINWVATLAIASVAEFLTILCLLWIIRIQAKQKSNVQYHIAPFPGSVPHPVTQGSPDIDKLGN